MSEGANGNETATSARPTMPKRDFIILPLISLLTVLVPVAIAESITRLIWTESTHDDCLFFDAQGARYKPFCSGRMKNIEGPWVRYDYNACGYRGKQPCDRKPPGTMRFVVMGTSIAFGLNVPQEQLFTERAAPELGRILGGPVQFENLGSIGPTLERQYEMVNEVQTLQPDGVFLVLLPFDLTTFNAVPEPNAKYPGEANRKQPHWFNLARFARSIRLFFMAQHFMMEDPEFAEWTFLTYNNPDDAAHLPPSPLVQQRFQRLGVLLRRLADGFRDRGIPLFVIPLPNRLQAVLIRRNSELPGVDATAFPRRVAELSRDAGAQFIDVVPELKRAPDVEKLYYPVDGHPTGAGHQFVAQSVLDYFRSRGASALSIAAPALASEK